MSAVARREHRELNMDQKPPQLIPPSLGPMPVELSDLTARVDSIERENRELGAELLRCYEQLNLVYQITEYVATLQEPAVIRETLLRRFAGLMQAGAMFIDDGQRFESIVEFETDAPRVTVAADDVRTILAGDIDLVRRTLRAHGPKLLPEMESRLSHARVLMGALREADHVWVVIVLRDAAANPFFAHDLLATDSVLGYGGHILNNVLMGRRLQQTAMETVRALATAIDAKDNYTSGHSERVGWLARLVGEALALPPGELQMLGWAGLLHDVGKIGVPEHILNKPGRLTDEEFAEIKKHPQIGYDVLKPVTHFGPVLDAVLYHHENHDGSGYPKGLAGSAIPLAARIVHVVDIFDALTSSRSYRAGFTLDKAIAILQQDSGRVTDPEITAAFVKAFRQFTHECPQDYMRLFAHLEKASAAETPPTPSAEGEVAQ